MFDTVLPYRYVQRDRNRWPRRVSWAWLALDHFHVRTPLGVRTYLVEVRAYPDHRFAASQVGDTMLDILARV